MSFQAMNHAVHVLVIRPDLDQAERLVLLLLANRHNPDEGAAWPSVTRLALEAGLTPRSVQRVIARLVAAGELGVSARLGASGGQLTNRYEFIGLDRMTPTSGGRVTPTSGGDDAHVRGEGDAHVRGGVTPTSPKPLDEPLDQTVMGTSALARAGAVLPGTGNGPILTGACPTVDDASAPPRTTPVSAATATALSPLHRWGGHWRAAFNRAINAAQLGQLRDLDAAAQVAGLPSLVPDAIAVCALGGHPPAYLWAVIERCLTDGRLPGARAAPPPIAHEEGVDLVYADG